MVRPEDGTAEGISYMNQRTHVHVYGCVMCWLDIVVIAQRKCCMCSNGTRGAVEIAVQHEVQPSAVWPIETYSTSML